MARSLYKCTAFFNEAKESGKGRLALAGLLENAIKKYEFV
jgi:hypothetical protein